MTDGQWALLAPLLPAAGAPAGAGQAEKWDRRLVLDAIFYLVRGGIAWRALPADFPPHQTVCAADTVPTASSGYDGGGPGTTGPPAARSWWRVPSWRDLPCG